ncbi:enolase C-terminal domain-like protein [Palleronia sp. KMU-117]|uniref:enolase C-terminal domain-like protein n=1 Tax=Palleronia sp. KMU-117 TaxID=3434108 RepID=UPI003D74FFCA
MTDSRALRILSARIDYAPVRFRLPFRFGDTRVTGTDQAFATVEIEANGTRATGRSAQLLVPRWFDKRPERTNDQTVADLRATCDAALAAAGVWQRPALLARAMTALRADATARLAPDTPRLAAGFGPSLLEVALIDALCGAHGLPFAAAARADLFGLAEDAPPDLSTGAVQTALGALGPHDRIAIRHTVGYDAPLSRADLTEDHPRDGAPVCLQDVIAETGIRAFKLKLKGDPDADIARLRAITGLIGPLPGLRVTLDANEQYGAPAFAAFLDALDADAGLAPLRAGLVAIEQPFAREAALAAPLAPRLVGLPLMIDESDDHEGAFATAIGQGWSGTSIKTCKGVLRALLNHARVMQGRSIGQPLFLSAEDLTCQLGLAWQQDTWIAATLGCPDIERNGHFHGGGMQGYAPKSQAALVAAHPDLYRTDAAGRVHLAIRDGEVALGSLAGVGLAP